MTVRLDPSIVDTELLDLARVVLEQGGYVVMQNSIDGTQYLIAEDPDNVIVLGAVIDVGDALVIEPALSRTIVDRLAESSPETKKWDGYVVVLSSTRSDSETTEALFSLTYNLSQVRRIVRVGVEATKAAVSRSLSPVLPLHQSQNDVVLGDPLESLEQRLIADGLAADQVNQAIASFRSQTPVIMGSSDADDDSDFDPLDDSEGTDG